MIIHEELSCLFSEAQRRQEFAQSHTAAERVRFQGPWPASPLSLRCLVAFGMSQGQPDSGPKEEGGHTFFPCA